jgi:hypothetical protein
MQQRSFSVSAGTGNLNIRITAYQESSTMPEPGEIIMLTPGTELHICPSCGYALGFHTSFLNAASRDNPIKSTREVYRVILICPECGARYDVGWRISFAEFESKFVKAPVVTPPPVPQSNAVACIPAPRPHDPPPSE